VAVLILGGTAAGCTRVKAKTALDVPALEVPAPPARDVEPAEAEPPQPATLPQEPTRTAPPRPRPAPGTATPPRPDTPKPEPPKSEPPPIAEPVRPADESPRPPTTTLQTTPAQAEVEVERGIRATLTRASSDLNRIDYRVLNSEARTQYDIAKRFISQSDAAIRAKNLEYARTLADKAAALAVQLGGK
jgi:hypothetical protein